MLMARILNYASTAKTIVMAMIYMPTPFPDADLSTWIRPDCRAYGILPVSQ